MLNTAMLLAGTELVCPLDIDSSSPAISATSFRTQTGKALHHMGQEAGSRTLRQTLMHCEDMPGTLCRH